MSIKLLFTAFTYACTFLSLDNEVRLISLVLQQFLFLITWFIDWAARINSSIRQTAFTDFTKLINHVCEHTAFLINMQFVLYSPILHGYASPNSREFCLPQSLCRVSFGSSSLPSFLLCTAAHAIPVVIHHMAVLNHYLGWVTLSIAWDFLAGKVLEKCEHRLPLAVSLYSV